MAISLHTHQRSMRPALNDHATIAANHTPHRARSDHYTWLDMRERCRNPRCQDYPRYGARGITFCERWRSSFENFIADMGERPSLRHSLERIDNDGPYCPENCQWATSAEQNNNRSFNRHIVVDGTRMTIAQASDQTGIKHATILSRLERGKSDEEAVRQ